MTSPFDRQAACPSCGAPISFRFAGAAAQVCKHCNFVVARTDRNLVAVGRMADLVDIPSPLVLGGMGRWNHFVWMRWASPETINRDSARSTMRLSSVSSRRIMQP